MVKSKIIQLSHPLEKIRVQQYKAHRVFFEVLTPSTVGTTCVLLSKKEAQEVALQLLKCSINIKD